VPWALTLIFFRSLEYQLSSCTIVWGWQDRTNLIENSITFWFFPSSEKFKSQHYSLGDWTDMSHLTINGTLLSFVSLIFLFHLTFWVCLFSNLYPQRSIIIFLPCNSVWCFGFKALDILDSVRFEFEQVPGLCCDAMLDLSPLCCFINMDPRMSFRFLQVVGIA